MKVAVQRKTRIAISIDKKVKEQIIEYSASKGVSVSSVIERCIRNLLSFEFVKK